MGCKSRDVRERQPSEGEDSGMSQTRTRVGGRGRCAPRHLSTYQLTYVPGGRILHLYVVNSIDLTFHVTAVSERRGCILHSIVTGRIFDLPLFMFQLIAASSDSTSWSDSMPFGLFLTHYLLSLGIECPFNYQLIKMPNTIDHVSARRSHTHSRPFGTPHPVPPQLRDPPPPSPVDPFGPSSSTPLVFDMNMLGAMLTSIQGGEPSILYPCL